MASGLKLQQGTSREITGEITGKLFYKTGTVQLALICILPLAFLTPDRALQADRIYANNAILEHQAWAQWLRTVAQMQNPQGVSSSSYIGLS
jgi:hypothetical protein